MKADSLNNLILLLEKKRRDSALFSLKKIQYPDNNRSLIFPFFKKLEKITRVPCEYVDERLTSFEARQNISELKTDLVDAHAAKILIDHWFNK